MRPNSRSVLTALRKVKDLPYTTIANGHGPIIRHNLEELVGRCCPAHAGSWCSPGRTALDVTAAAPLKGGCGHPLDPGYGRLWSSSCCSSCSTACKAPSACSRGSEAAGPQC